MDEFLIKDTSKLTFAYNFEGRTTNFKGIVVLGQYFEQFEITCSLVFLPTNATILNLLPHFLIIKLDRLFDLQILIYFLAMALLKLVFTIHFGPQSFTRMALLFD